MGTLLVRLGIFCSSILVLLIPHLASADPTLSCPLANYQWRSITVGAGGFAPNIVYSTVEPGLAYLRTDMGGSYRWDSKQERWIPLQDDLAESSYFGIESIALDPNDTNAVFVAAGMYKSYPAAILRSFNRGLDWEVAPVPFRMGGNEDGRGMGERLAVDPVNGNILYFGSRHDGLFKSVDRGKSWQSVDSFPYRGLGLPAGGRKTNVGISFVQFMPAGETQQTQRIIVAIADEHSPHLLESRDAGRSWQAIKNEPPASLRPAQAVRQGNQLFISYSNNTGPNGVTDGAVYRLDLATHQWTDITPGHNDTPNLKTNRPQGGFMGITASQKTPGLIAVATMNRWQPHDTIFVSKDGGASWSNIGPKSQRDVSATPYLYWGNEEADFGWWIAGLAFNPFDDNELVYTTGATVYRTRELQPRKDVLHWKPWIHGIEQTAVITLTSLPEGPELLSGFGDISGFVHTDFDRSPTVMFTNPVFANTNTIEYAALKPEVVVRSGTQAHRGNELSPTLAWSEDGGMHWQPLEVPAYSAHLMASKQRHDLTGNFPLLVSADGERFIFAGPRAMITGDRGKQWKRVKGLPENARPVADKKDPKRFYALDFDDAQMYMSDDGGWTFHTLEESSTGLPDNLAAIRPTWREKAWPLQASPTTTGELWLSSGNALYRSTDNGQSFTVISSAAEIEEMTFGKPSAQGKPTLLAIGRCDGEKRLLRSDDLGRSWITLNDDRHQYGQRFRTLAGDPRHFGRIYVATDGRGIVMGEPAP